MTRAIYLPDGVVGDIILKLLPFNGDSLTQPDIVYGGIGMAKDPTPENFQKLLDAFLECGNLMCLPEFANATITPDKVEFMSDAFPNLVCNRYRIEDVEMPYHAVLEFFGVSESFEDRQVHMFVYYDRPPTQQGEPESDLVSYLCGIVFNAAGQIFLTDIRNEEFSIELKQGSMLIDGARSAYNYYEYGDIQRPEPQAWLKANTSTR